MSSNHSNLAVVDIGLGNIHSLLGCLNRLLPNDNIEFTSDPKVIAKADCVILPGDGAFGAGVKAIDDIPNLREVLVEAAYIKPFLGICVGMQLLYEASEEDKGKGLGIISGTIKKFTYKPDHKIPLMGWLDVDVLDKHNSLFNLVSDPCRFYFLHSFYANVDSSYTVIKAKHTEEFSAAIVKDKLFATQFHPEKSSKDGVQLFANFLTKSGLCVA